MKIALVHEKPEWDSLIPPAKPDNSGVGVNYADEYLKALAATLPDGRKVAAKRKGLRVTLTVGPIAGDALLRKREHGPDVKVILREALAGAARKAGCTFAVEGGVAYLEVTGP